MEVVKDCMTAQYNEYIDYLRDVKKSSGNTLEAYVRDLRKFVDFAKEENINDYGSLSVEKAIEYKTYLINLGLSPSSISRTLSALRSFYQFLMSNGVVDHNPAREIPNDKLEKKGPQILTSKEIEKLLAQPNTKENKGIRDKAMLELLYATGIKVSEMVDLNVDDVNFQLSFVRCGSGEKERFVSLYPVAARALAEYVENARKLMILHPDEKALFVNILGERMTRQGFWKVIKNYTASAKIHKVITPHTLRHSFAAHLLENGANVHDIQEILGHSDISSTMRYTKLLKSKLNKGYIKFHPRA